MTIEIVRPNLARLIREEILTGHFESLDDLLMQALCALREKSHAANPSPAAAPGENLAEFLRESPFAGSDLNLERQQDFGRPVEL
jgi:hypothetical protein